MSVPDLVVRGPRVVRDGAVAPAAIHVRDGRIAAVRAFGDTGGAARVLEAGEQFVSAGLVDAHVHVNEPGRTEWEGYATATAAAAAGGITTIVDMPLNGIPPLLDAAAARARMAAIAAQARVDVALWGGLVSAGTEALAELAALGVAGVKCFLCPSGVDEFPHVGEAELDAAMPVLRALGLPLLAHAESPGALARVALPAGADPRAHSTWLASRPPAVEAEAVAMLVRLCRRHRAHVHVVHVSSREALAVIAAAKAEGLPLTAETCPHYLGFTAGAIPDGATVYKCAPPIREAAHRDALRAALADGTLDQVASDHSPCPPALKALDSGEFGRAWGGIAGLQLLLPATLTHAAAGGASPGAVARWLGEAPARLAGLASRKGRLEPGCDADFVLWSAARFTVRGDRLFHRHPLTPWEGCELSGTVQQTWLRGRLVYDRDRGLEGPPRGEYLPAGRRPAGAPRP